MKNFNSFEICLNLREIFTIGLNSNIPINNTFTARIDILPPSQYGGSIRIIPALDTGDASIGY